MGIIRCYDLEKWEGGIKGHDPEDTEQSAASAYLYSICNIFRSDRDPLCFLPLCQRYYPELCGNSDNSIQQGMCVFIVEPWRIDGTLHNVINENVAAMLLSDSNKLDLSYHTFGNIPSEMSMDDLKVYI